MLLVKSTIIELRIIRECQNNDFFEGEYFSNVISVEQYSLDCRTYWGNCPLPG